MSSGDAEPELIAKAVEGDRLALERLLLAHSLQLSLHIGAKLPDSVKGVVGVEDILQQTFVRAFQGIGRLEHTTQRALSAWLKRIAENQLRDAVRELHREKRGGVRRQICRGTEGQQSSVADLVDLLADRQHTPGRSAGRREAVHAVQVGIAALPADQREAVRQHLLEGKSLGETASAMGRTPAPLAPLSTVRSGSCARRWVERRCG